MCVMSLSCLRVFVCVVPTDDLANKLFGAPERSMMARSLPTAVPDSPGYRAPHTPHTPRTPRCKHNTHTPRFYPVIKDGRPVDTKVHTHTYNSVVISSDPFCVCINTLTHTRVIVCVCVSDAT